MVDTTMAAVSPLRRRMIDDMMLRNLSRATQRSYLYAVTKLSRHFERSPDRLGLEDALTAAFGPAILQNKICQSSARSPSTN